MNDLEVSPVTNCSFCGKHKDQVFKLIVGHEVAICSNCVDFCQDLLHSPEHANINKPAVSKSPNPRDIHQHLDQYVVGQDDAKVVLSVAISNHYKRINNPNKNTQIQKANILMIGPTGTGKTLMARTVADYLDVPFVIADATTLTEAGYVGDDVETLIARLYQAAGNDVERCQRGIIFLDEVDKIARRSESSTVSRDVSGEGVQQALLKLVEGTKCKIPMPSLRKGPDTVEIDTTNILFIIGGAFIGLDSIIKKRVQGTNMGFNATVTHDVDTALALVNPDDLVRYGIIPEFVGRFPSVITLHNLTKTQLITVLTTVKNNLLAQYKWLFDQDGIELEFDTDSLDLIVDRTMQNKTGARGLHSELERVLMPHMYNLPTYKTRNQLRVEIDKMQVNTPIKLLKENE